MNWQNITVSWDSTHFLSNGTPVFEKTFVEVLKFHAPGLAPVKDETGAYHIDGTGKELYEERYARTFGYYCNRAAVIKPGQWFHIDDKGKRAYPDFYSWAGNFQENICPVRNANSHYFHIDLNGERIYSQNFIYAGDYKDGIACVRTSKRVYRHIDTSGRFVHDKEFLDLGIFHKNLAAAKDKRGWHHINKNGEELYSERYLAIEPFYNGASVVDTFTNQKLVIDEKGGIVLKL